MRFNTLPPHDREAILRNMEIRRERFEHFVLNGRQPSAKFPAPLVLIIGDRPGPAAPKEPDYHHTPFYSVKHCSGWLNELLWQWRIDETKLLWLNAYDKDGKPTPKELLRKNKPSNDDSFPKIIALGGNAEKWLKMNGYGRYIKTDHPQYHKRFKNKEQYMMPLRVRDCLPLD